MWYLWCCYGDEDQGVCDIYDLAMVTREGVYVIFNVGNEDLGEYDIYDVAMVMKTNDNLWYLMLLWLWRPKRMWYLWCCYGDEEQGVCDI